MILETILLFIVCMFYMAATEVQHRRRMRDFDAILRYELGHIIAITERRKQYTQQNVFSQKTKGSPAC